MARIENRARLTDHGHQELRATVLDLAEVALAALSPSAGLRRSVTLDGKDLIAGGRSYDLSAVDRLVLLGAGKASAELATAVEQLLGPRLDGGVVVVPRPAERPASSRLTVLPGEHPVPGPASGAGARALLEQAGRLGERDLAICVFTGGSSALASLPPPGITNTDKARLHRLLLSSGMSVVEINTVRKHASLIKGGRLARAIAPARILNLTVSDVVGDPLDCITDPTVQDTSTVADALSVLGEWELLDLVPASVRDYLVTDPARSPDLSGADIHSVLLARGEDGTEAVLKAAGARGFSGVRLGGSLEGEAATAGRVLATLAREARAAGSPWPRGTVVVACGGECTVSLGPDADGLFGQGGPSQEAAAGAALALDGVPGIVALFADTDGSDGGTAIAGGLVDSSTAGRAREQGLSLRKGLVDHATTVLLEACGDAVLTGATQTNANDLIIIGVS